MDGSNAKHGWPMVSKDESVPEELEKTMFDFLTAGVLNDVLEIARFLHDWEKRTGKPLPPMELGRSAQQRRVYAGTIQ